MRKRFWKSPFWSVLAITMLLATAVFGQTSASLSGEIQDAQGRVIPNAKVRVSEPTKNIQLETTTSGEGVFSFATLQPGTYTLTVEANGFKQLVKTGIVINPADRQSAGRLTLEVGEVASTVTVMADAAQLQIKTESGEQGEVVTGRQARELALNGRNYLDLMKLTPGVMSTFNGQVAGPGGLSSFNINGTRNNQHNLTIDGSTNVDTGSNGTQHVALNLDTIEEFKILTSNYQAEYGRSAGGDIKVVTRSGGKDFHGTGYLFHRHEGFNANNFFSNQNGQKSDGSPASPRQLYRYNYFGYNIGGPIKLPKHALKDKLFFLWAQEWQRQLVPATSERRVRVPTAAEVNGDFSNTRDANGNLITVKDPTGQPFPGNKIPPQLINPSGQAILKLFSKFANEDASLPFGFNHRSQLSASYPRREETIRIDYNVTSNTRIFFRGTEDTDQQVLPYGLGWTTGQNFPLTPTIFKQGPARNAALNVTTTLSPTMTNEFIFGPSQNNLTLNTVDPNAATYAGIGLSFQPPFPYPASQFFDITFGGISGVSFAGITNYDRFPYKNSNTTFDFIDNVSKVWGSHTSKAGIYIQRSRKDQAAGNSARINFVNNPNNLGNTGHPYANALLGNFDTYQQATQGIYQGQYRSTNMEWFVQDNWKFNKKLTLDYGIRFTIMQPQFDQRLQASFFNPALWDPSKAVRLYRQTCRTTFPCSGQNIQAFDPANPTVLLPSFLIGRIVPGSGDPFDGIGQAAKGYLRGGIENRGVHFGPAVGFAYDVFGDSKTVVRGGYRIGYDRVSGNTLIFPAVENPPAFVYPTFNFGNLNTVGSSTGQIALAPFGVLGADPTGKLPTVHSFSLQVQRDIGFQTVVSAAYVGTLSSHLTQLRNLNYIPYGATFLRENQDPSQFPGGVVPDVEPGLPAVYAQAGLKFSGRFALPANFLRRYPGYGDIAYRENVGSSNYHSLQVTAQRRLSRGFTLGLAYTWSKAMDTANGDGDFTNPVCTRCYDYRLASFDRTHMLAINYVWDLPGLGRRLGDNWLSKAVFDGWELSGISQFMTGLPTEVDIGIPSVNLQQRINGSWTEPVRTLVVSNPQPSRTLAGAFDINAFALPPIGYSGPTPRQYLRRPGINVSDVSIFKNFRFNTEGSRYLQLRLEMFNAFNHPQFDNFNNGLTFNIKSDFSDYAQNRQASINSLRNLRGGTNSPATNPLLGAAVGEYSSPTGTNFFVSPSRVIQMAIKLYF